ncbi:MAG: M1 family metallopeptidase [Flavobacteriales bacterium]|nr:M1 family metallopeptidase [Flavobacteriales bacterium]
MQRLLYILLLNLFFTSGLVAQDHVHYLADPKGTPRTHSADITKMVVDVRFDPPAGKVFGKVTHTFTPLRERVDTLFWDAPGISILKVHLRASGAKDWKETIFNTNSTGLVTRFEPPLSWGNNYELKIEYEASPRKGIYFIGWNSPTVTDPRNQTRKQIWTQGQGIDNRYWIPMYDDMNDKFITETIVQFDEKYRVLSNGALKSEKKNGDGTKTWHYAMEKPHAGYLLMLAIDQFGVKETKTSRGTPVQFWYYPEHPEKVEPTSKYTETIIEFLEDETGFPYPWGTYSQVMVQDFMYGAMENTSATIFGDFFNVDERSFNDRNYVSVNAHELTHQWFGDLITARSGRGTWLQESFATYYAKLFMGATYGADEYAWNLRGEVQSALRAGEKDDYPVAHTQGGTSRVYPKGSAVLHMLRYVLGDAAYKKVIKYYLEQHAFGNVETNDLVQACEDVLGLNMRWFFDQWVYRGGEPHYEITRNSTKEETSLLIRQIQHQNATVQTFDMPIHIGVYFTDGSKVEKSYRIYRESELIRIPHGGNKTVSYVLFDINSEILKKQTFDKKTDELMAQLSSAEHMIDRYDALMGLSKTDVKIKREALQKQYQKEKHWSIKAEIVRQLMQDAGSRDWILTTLKSEDVRVRRVVLSELDSIGSYLDLFRSALNDASYINVCAAMKKLGEYSTSERNAMLGQTEHVVGQNHNVRLLWLQYKLQQLEEEGKTDVRKPYLDELYAYTTNLYEFRTRTAAFELVRSRNEAPDICIRAMLEASINPNRRLAQPAIDVLRYFNEQEQVRKNIQRVYDESGFSEVDKKRIRETGLVK